jgi:hypothetical protein
VVSSHCCSTVGIILILLLVSIWWTSILVLLIGTSSGATIRNVEKILLIRMWEIDLILTVSS